MTFLDSHVCHMPVLHGARLALEEAGLHQTTLTCDFLMWQAMRMGWSAGAATPALSPALQAKTVSFVGKVLNE